MITFQNNHATLQLGDDGSFLAFTDRSTGENYCVDASTPFAVVVKGGTTYPATSITSVGENIAVEFDLAGVRAMLRVTAKLCYFLVEVIEVAGPGVEELTFVDLRLTLTGKLEEPFVACALALNLRTNVADLPGPQSRLHVSCYPRFGFAGAKAALIGCPPAFLRTAMQDAVRMAPELPHSALGGPWALDAAINRGSYLFNFNDCTEQTVDQWIGLAQGLGFTQLDFHGGQSFRFGDCFPNPAMYPDGRDSLKRVIDRLHDAGIAAGLHTYAFFIDKQCAWVTPKPDSRLGSDATFTLSAPLGVDDAVVSVQESTDRMSTLTGFFVRNSITLRVDDELIDFTGVAHNAFTGCVRGAHGTIPTAHASGATAYHLTECFHLFAPNGDSTLLEEVAAATAETFNYCGFDMMYLDALDGEDVLGGPENGWYYGSKFVFEVWKRLERPALQEMSTFHHHLWFVRSRFGAWDHPNRAFKDFVDIHCASNAQNHRMLLPAHLGWWAITAWQDTQTERTFPDDLEYLCAKATGTETGFSLMGITPATFAHNPGVRRLAEIVRRWENLRHADAFSPEVKAQLRTPGAEFTLLDDNRVCPVRVDRRKVEGVEAQLRVTNPFAAQQPRLRIEALFSAEPYDSPDAISITDFADPCLFNEWKVAHGVTVELSPSTLQYDAGCFTARNDGAPSNAAWAMVRRTFTPLLNFEHRQALGVWVYGDGQGQVLNLQLRSPLAVSSALGEHYIIIDFTGWRYFTLIEPEGECYRDYRWPYARLETAWGSPEAEETSAVLHWLSGSYHIYREKIDYAQIECLSLWLNNIPDGKKVTCHLGPIRMLPLRTGRISNPMLTLNRESVTFPVTLETGQYLETDGNYCTVYGPDGAKITEVMLADRIPLLHAGDNTITFTCDPTTDTAPRANITVISRGEPL